MAFVCAVFTTAATPPAAMPNEVTLTTGRVLRNVQVVRWEKDRVVLRYTGGADPIPFALIKSIPPADLAALRDAGKVAAPAAKAAPAEAATFTVTGQAFDKGVDQAYKFVDMTVGIYPAGQEFAPLSRLGMKQELPAALAQGVTDADGKFSISSPISDGLLYARALRSYRTGSRAIYEWKVTFKAGTPLVLSGSAAKVTPLFSDL